MCSNTILEFKLLQKEDLRFSFLSWMKTPSANFFPGMSPGADQSYRKADTTSSAAPRPAAVTMEKCPRYCKIHSAWLWISSNPSARSEWQPLPPKSDLCLIAIPIPFPGVTGMSERAGPRPGWAPAASQRRDLRPLAAAWMVCGCDLVVTPADSKETFR